MALRLTKLSKTHKPQFRATLRLQRGWSQHNTLATLHAFDKLVSDMSQNSASNKIAQHQGRDYRIVETIAQKWGLEQIVDELGTKRVRKIQKGESIELQELEQDQHQELARKVMKTVLQQPLAGTSILMSAGREQSSISGLITQAINKVHKINMKAEPAKTTYVRRLVKEEKVKQINVGLIRDVEMHS